MPNSHSLRKEAHGALAQFLAQLAQDADEQQAQDQEQAGVKAGMHAGRVLCDMVDAGLDHLSLPGGGQTLQRWQALAAVAAHDLSLAKLFEGHTDALAILAEAEVEPPAPLSVWGVWCAEPPQARLQLHRASAEGAHDLVLDGRKAWCSGANILTHAIVSGWNQEGQACLAAVDLDQPGITIRNHGWHAVGMAGTVSVEVEFAQARGIAIGAPNFYTERPGFWHGGAGIAACWHGAAAQLASYLRARLALKGDANGDPHALAHLGRADVALSASAWGLRAAAQQIDQAPTADAYRLAMRARLASEHAATEVLQQFGRALGPAAMCNDPWVARMVADLPVYLRQSHAEHDLAALAQSTLHLDEWDDEWRL